MLYVCVLFFSADKSGDQLSENPGFPLLYVRVAVLLGVNISLSFPGFEYIVLLVLSD